MLGKREANSFEHNLKSILCSGIVIQAINQRMRKGRQIIVISKQARAFVRE